LLFMFIFKTFKVISTLILIKKLGENSLYFINTYSGHFIIDVPVSRRPSGS
jgi:hypothetical protein